MIEYLSRKIKAKSFCEIEPIDFFSFGGEAKGFCCYFVHFQSRTFAMHLRLVTWVSTQSWLIASIELSDLILTQCITTNADVVDAAVPGPFAAVRVPPNPHVETVCRNGSGYGGRDVAPAVNVQCRRPAVVTLFAGGVIRRDFERDVLRMNEGAWGIHGAGQADVRYAGLGRAPSVT